MPGQGPIGVPPTDLIDEAGSEDGAAGQPRECVPACDGFSRGPDGCGGMCVVAFNDTTPGDAVAMNCVPQCQDRLCGDDGCGGLCGRCGEGLMCQDGACVCEPEVALVCCNAGTQTCWVDGCGEVGKAFETCAEGCHDDACCVPDCREKSCGDDGCGGSCGSCPEAEACLDGICACAPAAAVACCQDGAALCSYDSCGHLEGVAQACETGCADDACCDHCGSGHQCGEDGSCFCGELGVACPEGFACTDGHCVGGLDDEVFIPSGRFVMGCSGAEGASCIDHLDELPRRLVTVAGFAMDRVEVTAADYHACVSSCGCDLPLMMTAEGATYATPGKQTHPINFVTWAQAEAYCDFQDKRLCSEAEWEFAGRGSCDAACAPGDYHCCEGAMPIYPWGDEGPTCDEANYGGATCVGATSPVGSHPNGVSPYGVQDLSGNVWEWVQDCWHEDYLGAPETGEAWVGPEGICDYNRRVIRGGAFNYGSGEVRLAERVQSNPKFGSVSIGFRCCRDLELE